MDVVEFFVTKTLSVYHTDMYVVDMQHAVIKLMKQTVVRDLECYHLA